MIIIRNGTLDDIENLIKLDTECFGEGENNTYDKKFWEYLLTRFCLLVAEDDSSLTNGLIGVISVTEETKPLSAAIKMLISKHKINKYFLVVSLCVSKNYRSTGIGSELMRRAIKNAKNYVLLNVRESNKKAINFYKNYGFEVYEYLDVDYYDDPQENGLLMWLKK